MTRPMYIFRICPADPCLIEWRRNKLGAEWLYWCTCQTVEEARAALEGIEQAGFVIERLEDVP